MEEEDAYVTMRPRRSPSPNGNSSPQSSPLKYGFPRQPPLTLHTYDLPPYARDRANSDAKEEHV